MAKTYIMTEFYEVKDEFQITIDEEKFAAWAKEYRAAHPQYTFTDDELMEDYIMEEIMDNDWENNENVELITNKEQVGELQGRDFQLVDN